MIRTILAIIGVVLGVFAAVLGYKNRAQIKDAFTASDLKTKVLTPENKAMAWNATKASAGFGWAVTKGACHLVYGCASAAIKLSAKEKEQNVTNTEKGVIVVK